MKDWKTWAIVLLAGVVLFQYLELRDLKRLYSDGMRLRIQEIDKVRADALDTRLNHSLHFIAEMNCAEVENTLKQWNACVTKLTTAH